MSMPAEKLDVPVTDNLETAMPRMDAVRANKPLMGRKILISGRSGLCDLSDRQRL